MTRECNRKLVMQKSLLLYLCRSRSFSHRTFLLYIKNVEYYSSDYIIKHNKSYIKGIYSFYNMKYSLKTHKERQKT